MERQDAILMARWIENGGRVIVAGVPSFASVEATDEPEKTLFSDTPKGRTLGKGSICRVGNQEEAATRLGTTLRELGLVIYDMKKDGVYGTQIAPNSYLFLNTGKEASEARVLQVRDVVPGNQRIFRSGRLRLCAHRQHDRERLSGFTVSGTDRNTMGVHDSLGGVQGGPRWLWHVFCAVRN